MSQVDFMRELDGVIVSGLVDAGMGDEAIYTPPGGGAGVPCQVLVDRAAQFFGDLGEVAGRRVVVALFLAQATPARGGIVAVGTETFRLESLEQRDDSMSRWVVVNG